MTHEILRTVVSKRIIDAFNNGYQNYERNELNAALDVMLRLIPPEYFDHYINEYAKEKSWETWKHVTNCYETHSIHEDLERIEFEKYWENIV